MGVKKGPHFVGSLLLRVIFAETAGWVCENEFGVYEMDQTRT
jgi:hypothetical protein